MRRSTYSDMVVDVLRPSKQIYQSVDGGQFASEEFLLLGVAHPFQAPDVVDWQCATPETPTSGCHHRNPATGNKM